MNSFRRGRKGSDYVLLKRGEFTPIPKLDFSKPIRHLTYAELEEIAYQMDLENSRRALLERISFYKAHPECLISWDVPYTMDELERMLLSDIL